MLTVDCNRVKNFKQLSKINSQFLKFFKSCGLIRHKSEKVSSGIDPTVRFIGSHTSILKKYIENNSLPQKGFCIIQDCLKTTNLNIFYNDNQPIYFGSYFPCHGVLVHYSNLKQIVSDTICFIYKQLNISLKNIEIWINSQDRDLLKSIEDLAPIQLDHLPINKYIHKFGMDGITGRNLHIAINNADTGIQEYFAVIIVIEKLLEPLYVEVAISPTIILKQLYSLDHILDCYPVPQFSLETSILSRKLEDCVITITLLYKEGLYPSNHHNRNRLLKKYLIALGYIRKKLYLDIKMVSDILEKYEQLYYTKNLGINQKIIEDLMRL
jgi:hypothetical protein